MKNKEIKTNEDILHFNLFYALETFDFIKALDTFSYGYIELLDNYAYHVAETKLDLSSFKRELKELAIAKLLKELQTVQDCFKELNKPESEENKHEISR